MQSGFFPSDWIFSICKSWKSNSWLAADLFRDPQELWYPPRRKKDFFYIGNCYNALDIILFYVLCPCLVPPLHSPLVSREPSLVPLTGLFNFGNGQTHRLLSLSLWSSGGARPLLSYSLRSQSLSGLFVCAMFFQFTSLFPLILILSLQEFNLFVLLFVCFLLIWNRIKLRFWSIVLAYCSLILSLILIIMHCLLVFVLCS